MVQAQESQHAAVFHLSTVQCSTVQRRAVQCSTVQCSTVQCSVVQYSAVRCSAVQCSTVQCSAVQYSTVQYSVVQCSTVHTAVEDVGSSKVTNIFWRTLMPENFTPMSLPFCDMSWIVEWNMVTEVRAMKVGVEGGGKGGQRTDFGANAATCGLRGTIHRTQLKEAKNHKLRAFQVKKT
jgi:hypothetical protein